MSSEKALTDKGLSERFDHAWELLQRPDYRAANPKEAEQALKYGAL